MGSSLPMTKPLPHAYYFSPTKRILDVTVSVVVAIITAPLWLIISICIWLDSGRPIFFLQKRTGQHKKTFIMWKFRTMRVDASKKIKSLQKLNEAPYPMFKMTHDPRFTTFGKWLSRTGLDELPQLINILKGEMSIVGPRPLPVEQARELTKEWDFRYEIRPGIISLWAIASNRHMSLSIWRKLELSTLRAGSVMKDIDLIRQTISIIWVKSLVRRGRKLL